MAAFSGLIPQFLNFFEKLIVLSHLVHKLKLHLVEPLLFVVCVLRAVHLLYRDIHGHFSRQNYVKVLPLFAKIEDRLTTLKLFELQSKCYL